MKLSNYSTFSKKKQYKHLVELATRASTPDISKVDYTNEDIPEDIDNFAKMNIFHDIPFYPGYRITRTGRVVNLDSYLELTVVRPTDWYATATVRRIDQTRNTTQHLHRLLAHAFLKPLKGISPLNQQVNHKDGNKANNSVDNLEWCTHQENCAHAYRTGLRTDNEHIRITNPKSDKVIEVYSMAEAGRFFGGSAPAIHYTLNAVLPPAPYKGYLIEYADREITAESIKTFKAKRNALRRINRKARREAGLPRI